MRVMCIKNGDWVYNDEKVTGNCPSFGEVCNVLRDNQEDNNYFILSEYEYDTDGILQSFYKPHFIILSNIDEMELNTHTVKEVQL